MAGQVVSGPDPSLGLALGSGAARGWAHIGVIRALAEQGIRPGIVCGSSIGALVGGAFAAGQLDALEQWVRSLTWGAVLRHLDLGLSGGGLIQGERLMAALSRMLRDLPIEALDIRFAAVVTELETGRERWLRQGSLLQAIRASIALPGLFTPARFDDRWLIDGGVVNPVPVSVCRALGARRIIAINLNGNIVGRHFRRDREAADAANRSEANGALARARAAIAQLRRPSEEPGILDVVAGALNIMQDSITRSRLAGDPADVVIAPQLAQVGLMEFDRAAECIAEGRASVERLLPELRARL